MSNTATIPHTIPQSSTPPMGPNFVTKAVVKFRATKHAKKVISALNEVKKVRQGKKAPKSFDDFLNEL
jgi:hypothetical protein